MLHALFGAAAPTLDAVFDGLADFIDSHFAASVVPDLIRIRWTANPDPSLNDNSNRHP